MTKSNFLAIFTGPLTALYIYYCYYMINSILSAEGKGNLYFAGNIINVDDTPLGAFMVLFFVVILLIGLFIVIDLITLLVKLDTGRLSMFYSRYIYGIATIIVYIIPYHTMLSENTFIGIIGILSYLAYIITTLVMSANSIKGDRIWGIVCFRDQFDSYLVSLIHREEKIKTYKQRLTQIIS